MTITEMLGQSLKLTLLGMGFVFLILIIMIVFITLNSKLIKALKLDKNEKTADNALAAGQSGGTQTAVIAAIAAAVHEKENG